jgi:hypothetical protein
VITREECDQRAGHREQERDQVQLERAGLHVRMGGIVLANRR